MPAAPASRQSEVFCSETPPRARTGIGARQAWRSVAMPAGAWAGEWAFSKTGAKTAKSALFVAACITSSAEWQEMAIKGDSGAFLRIRATVALVQMFLTSVGVMSLDRRWTPCAPTAIATSARELMRRAVLSGRSPVASLASRMTRTASSASVSSSRAGRSFSRS